MEEEEEEEETKELMVFDLDFLFNLWAWSAVFLAVLVGLPKENRRRPVGDRRSSEGRVWFEMLNQ